MWLMTQWKLYRALRQYQRDHNLTRFLENDWGRDHLLCELIEGMESSRSSRELSRLQQKQAEYLALQNQINPHFLYNTLEAIRADAILADCEEIAETTEALATFYRYTISNVREFVSFSDELDNVENYFTVQKCRFGEKLRLEVTIEEERLLEAQMPKLILQPLVENAIVHGLEGKIGEGTVRICIDSSDKTLFLRVQDDGIGISKEQVRFLNETFSGVCVREEQETWGPGMSPGKKRGGSIALRNVNSRVQLMFGEDYGLRIFSVEGSGTECVLTMPLTIANEGAEKA
ncbi:MAG: histidine kinase [Eubacterium sp.]|nr:histidine kinase [Eubacterium sp.]